LHLFFFFFFFSLSRSHDISINQPFPNYVNQDAQRWSELLDDFWNFQTCTEFAFYQTCELGSQCMFTQGLDTLALEIAFCPQQYGVTPLKVAQNVAASNAYYGGRTPATTCVLYVNGEVDPWHSLSILSPPTPTIQTAWVLGASHHAWTHPTSSTDQESVVQARNTIRDFVAAALNQSCMQATTA
jgi:serine protease 16